MIKLAGLIIDSYDDPKFVSDPMAKERLPSPEAISALKDRDFAVIIKTAARTHRKYPICSADLVKVSSAYYNEYSHYLDEDMREAARTKIQEAAVEYGVKLAGAVSAPASASTFVFTAIAPQQYEDFKGVTKQAAFDIAVDRFVSMHSRMTPFERAMAASALNKLGSISDQRVFDYVPKATYGPKFVPGIKERLSLIRDNHIKVAQLGNLVEDLIKRDAQSGAVLLDKFDKLAELENRVPDAFITCWGGFIQKEARDVLSEEERAIETLAVVHGDIVKRVLNESTASSFIRDPVGFYRKSSGPAKTTLNTLVRMVKQSVKQAPAVNRQAMPEAKKDLRDGG